MTLQNTPKTVSDVDLGHKKLWPWWTWKCASQLLDSGSETDVSPQLMALKSTAVLVPTNVAGMLRQDHSWEMGENWFPLTDDFGSRTLQQP